ncbi:hypothetical protein SISSUDRAFT_1051906 [Sistotremastrum suecicum HHB10207 ss-3]|uniref:RING-type domain-containing protein n=1 Tax=Sistotremastrum suecicum HHB10207 ss-3 TaxID=1314776 RepID=A0A166A8T2_9AGAM|nr:hypothetical protein SISSUDRAFT_1051906 [Sistotremastrum suecicum HHB10207 ss-3]
MAHVRRRDDSETTSTSTSRGALESQPLLSATKESYVPGDSRLVATSSQALQGKNEQQDPRTMSLEEKEAEVNNRMAELEIMKKRVEEDRAALEDRKERLKKRERAFRRNSDEQSRNAENSTREVKKGVNNEFLKAVECPICSDILAAPHVLTCGHSFCFSDIHTMALNAFSLELDGFVNFHCPLCRVPILIPGYNPEVHKVAPPFYCSPCRPLQAVIELATRNMQDLGVEGWGEEGEELQRWKQREKEGQDLAEMIKLHWSNNDARDLFSSLKQSML